MADAVLECTNQDLIDADWTKNLELCDQVNLGDTEFKTQVVNQLAKRLDGKNPKIVGLAMTLFECLEKNCVYSFHKIAHDKNFLNNFYQIAVGSRFQENIDQARKLVQELALSYAPYKKEFNLYGSMYRSLNNKGIEFPPDDTVSVFSPIMTEKAKAVSDFSLKGKIYFSNPNAKIEYDLHQVQLHMMKMKGLIHRRKVRGELSEEKTELLKTEEDYLAQCLIRIINLIVNPNKHNLKESNMKLCYLLKDNLILLLQAYKDDNIDESKVVVYPEDEREAAEHVEESDEDLIDIDKDLDKEESEHKKEEEDKEEEINFEDLFKD